PTAYSRDLASGSRLTGTTTDHRTALHATRRGPGAAGRVDTGAGGRKTALATTAGWCGGGGPGEAGAQECRALDLARGGAGEAAQRGVLQAALARPRARPAHRWGRAGRQPRIAGGLEHA